MKTFAGILFICFALFPLVGFGQVDIKTKTIDLPIEIQTFYANSNLVNSLTTSEEKKKLINYLSNGKDKKVPSSKREKYVLKLLKHIVGKEIIKDAAMPNSLGQQSQTLSNDIYEIQNWRESEDCIFIATTTSYLSQDDNLKLIRSFEEGEFDQKIAPLPKLKITAKEIHKWVPIDRAWFKNNVHLVLTD